VVSADWRADVKGFIHQFTSEKPTAKSRFSQLATLNQKNVVLKKNFKQNGARNITFHAFDGDLNGKMDAGELFQLSKWLYYFEGIIPLQSYVLHARDIKPPSQVVDSRS